MLKSYDRILVTTDFTPNSDHAFRHAVLLARHNDAKIHLLHVMPMVDSSMRGYLASVMGEAKLKELEQSNIDKAHDALKAELDAFVTKELQNNPEDLARFAGSEVVAGYPVAMILEAAERLDVDVIVMGTHSKGALEHTFLGSTTEKVIKKSPRPIMAIPLPPK